jgi:hypothetical protein
MFDPRCYDCDELRGYIRFELRYNGHIRVVYLCKLCTEERDRLTAGVNSAILDAEAI